MRCPIILISAASIGVACNPGATHPAAPAEPTVDAATAPAAEAFEATVQIDSAPGYKKFQGVWLERDDGARWVVAYRPEGWLAPFAGRRVRVTGERYEPEGQAILAPHLRVHTLRLVDPKADGASLIAVGPERVLVGAFADRVGAPHTKSEGEVHRVFTAVDGSSFLLANAPEGAALGRTQAIRARVVEPSPFVARLGGSTLWVLAVEAPRP